MDMIPTVPVADDDKSITACALSHSEFQQYRRKLVKELPVWSNTQWESYGHTQKKRVVPFDPFEPWTCMLTRAKIVLLRDECGELRFRYADPKELALVRKTHPDYKMYPVQDWISQQRKRSPAVEVDL